MSVAHLILWIALALAALWLAARYLPAGADSKRPLTEIIALTPLLIAPIVVLVAAAALMHDESATAVAVILALVWCEESLRIRHSRRAKRAGDATGRATVDATGAPTLTIMTINCRYGRANAQAIANAVKLNHVNVLALQEVDEHLYAAVSAALGASIAAPTQKPQKTNAAAQFISSATDSLTPEPLKQFLAAKNSVDINDASAVGFASGTAIRGEECADDNGGFNAIFADRPCLAKPASIDIHAANVPAIAYPIAAGRSATANGSDNRGAASAHTADSPVRLIMIASAHPKSPGRGGAYWGYGLKHLADFPGLVGKPFVAANQNTALDGGNADENAGKDAAEDAAATVSDVIVCGDLNSSVDFPSFRRALAAGFTDSTIDVRDGYKPTFPNSWPLTPDMLELDHVLHTAGLAAESVKVIDISGSDHAGLVARLRAI